MALQQLQTTDNYKQAMELLI